jgi:hypothetical protein
MKREQKRGRGMATPPGFNLLNNLIISNNTSIEKLRAIVGGNESFSFKSCNVLTSNCREITVMLPKKAGAAVARFFLK